MSHIAGGSGAPVHGAKREPYVTQAPNETRPLLSAEPVHRIAHALRWERWAGTVLPTLAVLVMVFSGLAVFPAAASGTPATSATQGISGSHLSTPSTTPSTSSTPSPTSALPFTGSSAPSGPANAGTIAAYPPAGSQFPGVRQYIYSHANLQGISIPSSAPVSSPTAPLGVHPASGTNQLATATGTIEDTFAPHSGISGALVSPNPIGGVCQNQSCPPVYSGSSGYFSVKILQGSDQITIAAGYYVSNFTVLTNVTAGSTYNLGIIYLVPDAQCTGYVEGNDSTHEAVPGVIVTGSTRDGKIIATPSTVTDSKGHFDVPVPPGPAEIQFSPLAKWGIYIGTTVFVDAAPGYVGSCGLGIVHMTVGVIVTATPYNLLTGKKIVPMAGYIAMQVCARTQSGDCFTQGTAVPLGSQNPVAVAPPGADVVTVEADNFIANTTDFVVPQESPGHTYNLGNIYLIPNTPVTFWPNMTWKNNVKNAENLYGVGLIYATTCSLNGYQFGVEVPNSFFGINMSETRCSTGGCLGPGSQFFVAAAPLRNSIVVLPDLTRTCGFAPTWPIPGLLPVTGNTTWVNVTMGHTVNAHSLDMTPGNYIEGTVDPSLAASAQPNWTVAACSTDEVSQCYPASLASIYGNPYQVPVNGCPVAADTFCVAAPPGPDIIKVQSGSTPTNFTEAYNPPGVWKYTPYSLCRASANGICSINLTSGLVSGRILDQLTGKAPGGIPSVEVTPAGLSQAPPVSIGVNAAKGTFSGPAPDGWDVIVVSAPNYESNRTWAYVSSTSVNLGTIYLTPLSFVTGRVLGPNGFPLNTTSVQICTASGTGCLNTLGSGGLTNTNGSYYQLVVANHLPIGAYRIVANAPGYLSNQTWLNVTTPGTTVTATTLYLQPILGSPRGLGPHARPMGPLAQVAEWVDGRVIDNSSGIGLPDTSIVITAAAGGVGSGVAAGTISTDGYFNFSQNLGSFWFNFSDAGFYYPASVFAVLNASGPSIQLGTIRMIPLHYLHGRLLIAPWEVGVTEKTGVSLVGIVHVCVNNLSLCGGTGDSDTGGFFNVSAPVGKYDQVFAVATGNGLGESGPGFIQNKTLYNVTLNNSGTPFAMSMIIYMGFSGMVLDNSTQNTTPVRYGTVTVQTRSVLYGPYNVGETLNGGGAFTVFTNPGNITYAYASGSAYESRNFAYNFGNASIENLTNTTQGAWVALPQLSLVHYGWIQFEVVANVTPLFAGSNVVPFAQATATMNGPNGTQFSSVPVTADGVGFVNMTAAPGTNVTVAVTAPDFNVTSHMGIRVNQSATTFYNGTGYHELGNISINPWGWAVGQVIDPVAGSGVPGAGVAIQNNNSVPGASGVLTNMQGDFFIDAPLGIGLDPLAVSHDSYQVNNTKIRANAGMETNIGTVNLTGDGIVAGRVIGYPSGQALYGAYVTVCPVLLPACTTSNATTNGTGYFWVAAAPGLDVINITITGYASNDSEELKVLSDGWFWAGTFDLAQYAVVDGILLGTPSGYPLDGANASMCSPLALPGTPTGPCFLTVRSDVLGQFSLSTPPGDYILALNATNYNASYLPIALSPGEQVNVGTIYLQAYGIIVGTILAADKDAPVTGTIARACPLWVAGNCTSLTHADSSGRFLLAGPPGAYVLIASAPGYQDAYVDEAFVSGATTTVPPIFLTPVGTSVLYRISGTVVGGTNLTPLAGAVVSAGTNYATAAGATGAYSLVVPWGTYFLSAAQNGYVSVGRTVSVHENLSGIDFVLPQNTYTVSGIVRDGLTSGPLSQVQILLAGQVAATTSSQAGGVGVYSFTVPNGTYTLETQVLGLLASTYAVTAFSVSVNGANVVRNVQLFPPQAKLYGVVVDGVTGAALSNASVTVQGTTVDNLPQMFTVRTTSLGVFTLPLYLGAYTVNASADGYLGNQVSANANQGNTTLPVTITLTPVSNGAAPTSSGIGLGPILVVGAVAAVGVVAYVSLGRLRASSPGYGPSGASTRGTP